MLDRRNRANIEFTCGNHGSVEYCFKSCSIGDPAYELLLVTISPLCQYPMTDFVILPTDLSTGTHEGKK